MQTPANHDGPYKRMFSHPRVVADLIRGFLAPEFAAAVDFSSLTRGNGSYVADDLRDRSDDIIWHVRWGDQDLVVYLLFEFQSAPDPRMPVRIMEYVALLYQDVFTNRPELLLAPWPAVLPIVCYNGDAPWRAPTDVGEAIGPMPPGFAAYRPRVPYLLLDETRLSLHQRDEVRNLASAIFALEQAADPPAMIRLGVSIREWLSAVPELADLNKDFALFYSHSLTSRLLNPPPNPFLDTPMLAERVQRWIDVYRAEGEVEGEARGKAEGEARGKAEGKAEGLIAAILSLVSDGDLPRERAVVRLLQLAEQGLITPVQLATALSVLES